MVTSGNSWAGGGGNPSIRPKKHARWSGDAVGGPWFVETDRFLENVGKKKGVRGVPQAGKQEPKDVGYHKDRCNTTC